MKRIRYQESEAGLILTSPKLIAGKTIVQVTMNLKTNNFVVKNTETDRHIGSAITFTTKAEGMKKAKTTLKALGVIFADESRNRETTKTYATTLTANVVQP